MTCYTQSCSVQNGTNQIEALLITAFLAWAFRSQTDNIALALKQTSRFLDASMLPMAMHAHVHRAAQEFLLSRRVSLRGCDVTQRMLVSQ